MKPATTPSPRPPVTSWAVRLLAAATWIYLALTVAACVALYLLGDRWWPASLLLFGPRWVLSLPLVLLAPLTLLAGRWRLLLPLVLAALIVFVPFMGLRFPMKKSSAGGGKVFRVVTCNIHSEENVPALLAMAGEVRADLIALQECPPDMAKRALGWHVLQDGGLAILSRQPILSSGRVQTVRVPYRWPGTAMIHARTQVPGGAVTVCNIHLPTPRYGLQGLLNRRTGLDPAKSGEVVHETWYRESSARTVRDGIDALEGAKVVVGDFNTPVESTIYRRVWGDLTNGFDRAGKGYGITQRVAVKGFTFGARIDHVLTGPALTPRVCQIGPDVGSDHLPVVADLVFVQ